MITALFKIKNNHELLYYFLWKKKNHINLHFQKDNND